MSDLTEVGRHAHKKKKRRYEATNEAPEGGDVLEPLCYDDEIPEVPKKKKHKKRHTESESVGKELSPVSPFPDGNVFSEKKHKKKHTHQSADEEINLSGKSSNRLDHLEEAGVKKKKKKKQQHNNYDYDDDDGHGNAVPASLSEENGVECNGSDILEQEPPQPCKKKKKQSNHAEEGNMDENVMPAEVNVHVPKKKRKKKHQEEAFSEEIGESTGNELYHQSAQISNEESGISERNSAEDAGTNTVPKQKMKDKEETAIENVNDQPVQQDSLSLDSELINEESLNVSKKKKKRKKLKDIESNVSAECTPPAESVSFNDGSADGDASGLQDDNTLYKRKKAGKKNHRVHFSGAEAGHNSEEMLPNDEQDTFSGLDGNGTDFSSMEMGRNIDGVVEEDHDLMETENSDAQKQLQKKKKHKKKYDRQSDEPLQPDEPENYYELARSEDITSDYLNSASAAVHDELKDDTKKGKKRHKDRKDHAKNTDCTGIDGNVDKAHSGSSKEEGSVPSSRLDHGDTSIRSRPHAKKKKKRSTAIQTGDSEGFPLHKHKSKKKRKKDDVAPNEKASSKDMHKKKKKRHNETKGSLANAHSQNHTKKHKKKHKREHSKSVNSHKNTKRKKRKKESENPPEHVEHTSNSSFIDDIVDGSEGIEDPSTTAFISKVLGPLDSYTVESSLDTSEEPPDFEVPLLHATGSVKPLPKKEKESLLAQGVAIRNGRWTKAERSILMKNWEDFAEKFQVEDPGVFLGINQSGSDMVKIRKFNAAKHFYVRLARDLNERTLYSVYRQARQLLHPHRNSGKFSENDVNTLNTLRNLHGNQWSKISEVMDKPAESCRGSFRIHKEGRKTGAWSNEERDRLKKAVERFTKEENVQNSPNSSQNIPWEEVSKLVETRNSAQCREQWYKCKSFHVDKQQLSEWGEINEACLIYLLYHNMVEDEVLVNWRALFPAFRKCLVSYKGLAKKWFFIKRKVTDYKSKTHSEIVTHLYTKHLPYLISRLGTSMSHLESLANHSEPTTGK